ncbi:MAG: fatty acid desaturase [Alkalinema sp. CACIAM 70d]|nr:MAG: fatty acid desaturase [Alkalinema sp. CACIAM 70d]
MTAIVQLTQPTPHPLTAPGSKLRLKDIIKTLPRECFQKNARKAWTQVVVNIAMVALGYCAIALSPWYLLPLAWIFTGTALTGFFVIGHDCGHRSFAKRRWVNDLVGHLVFLPLIYPFHSWRLLHDVHHRYTNKMDVDNAWQPFRTEYYDSLDPVKRTGYELMRGKFWWIGSILHWALIHFDLENYKPRDRAKANFSNWFVIIGGVIGLSLLLAFTGPWGLVKFWLMPWMVYHFWMSTFTIVHHTLPGIPFQEPEVWDEAKAQLFGTVHCDYPFGVEFLCHKINVHIPHHLSVAIPSYNLRIAHNRLKEIWGDELVERRFNWDLVKEITDNCHLYEPETSFYQTFAQYKAKKAAGLN